MRADELRSLFLRHAARRVRTLPEWVAPVIIVGLRLLLDVWILHHGFTHVSDDDYSRTTISELFAHAPRLDPSGTSWLPLPFWIEGTLLAIFGRSLGVARGIAVGLSAAGSVLPYWAMRASGTSRVCALATSCVTALLPWNVWLGVATVPDGWVGDRPLTGVIGALGARRHRGAWAIALLAASLSRYETWSACAVVAFMSLLDGIRRRDFQTDINNDRSVSIGTRAMDNLERPRPRKYPVHFIPA